MEVGPLWEVGPIETSNDQDVHGALVHRQEVQVLEVGRQQSTTWTSMDLKGRVGVVLLL